jgi:hypothetical protein
VSPVIPGPRGNPRHRCDRRRSDQDDVTGERAAPVGRRRDEHCLHPQASDLQPPEHAHAGAPGYQPGPFTIFAGPRSARGGATTTKMPIARLARTDDPAPPGIGASALPPGPLMPSSHPPMPWSPIGSQGLASGREPRSRQRRPSSDTRRGARPRPGRDGAVPVGSEAAGSPLPPEQALATSTSRTTETKLRISSTRTPRRRGGS